MFKNTTIFVLIIVGSEWVFK